jgi:aerobic-type carbon monoxide dehydrogenase small subunit (CoxS/CutS family)
MLGHIWGLKDHNGPVYVVVQQFVHNLPLFSSYCTKNQYLSLNRVLRRIFGRKREEVLGGWRRLHIEVLYNMYSSSNIITAIKLRLMRWAWHVARM